jgi:hypothetical protein
MMLAATTALAPAAAMADPGTPPTTDACPTSTWYDIVGHSSYLVPAGGLPIFKDGAGGSLDGRSDKELHLVGLHHGGTSIEMGGVIAKAKVEVSASLTSAASLTVLHNYDRVITAGKYGNVQYGSWGQQVSWRKYYDGADCTTKLRASGTARIPSAASVGWKYWETST